MNRIFDYLDELFPNPTCELIYHKDYELLIAIMLSAQTTDKRVNSVTSILFSKYPSLQALSDADVSDIGMIIKSIGTFRKKAVFVKEIATRLVSDGYLRVPNDRDYLSTLPGVGRKTINVFLSNIFDVPAIAVDTHVERISKRLRLANIPDDVLDVEKKLMRKVPKDRWSKTHHQMVLFGRYHCKSLKPECDNCRLQDMCRYYKSKIKN